MTRRPIVRLRQRLFFIFLIRYLTLAKIINFLTTHLDYLAKRIKARGYPYFIFVDPGNICNLRCLHCPTGLRRWGRKPGLMTFEQFKKIFDQFFPYLIVVGLYNWGEPFLNKDIYQMTQYAHKKNVATVISSNLNTIKPEDIDKIINSGLDVLTVSLDGASPETYQKYRRGGDFNRVVKNIKLLVKRRKELEKKNPKLRWQFIVNCYNEHEVEKAKNLARKIGVDQITFDTRFKLIGHMFHSYDKKEAEKWLPKGTKYFLDPLYTLNRHCDSLWQLLTVNYDGGVSPCCGIDDAKSDFGNLLKERLTDLWNNKYYQHSRSIFKKDKVVFPEIKTICHNCRICEKPNYLKRYEG